MALIMREGDYVPNGKGGFETAEGVEELLERVLWKLSIRRGSFPFLPTLGSRLHLLGRTPVREQEAVAGQYVREALSDEDLTVEGVALTREEDRVRLTAKMEWQGQELTATVEMGGTA